MKKGHGVTPFVKAGIEFPIPSGGHWSSSVRVAKLNNKGQRNKAAAAEEELIHEAYYSVFCEQVLFRAPKPDITLREHAFRAVMAKRKTRMNKAAGVGQKQPPKVLYIASPAAR